MHIRTNLHAGADSAKGLSCAQQLNALNQQINAAEYALTQCNPKKPIIVNPPDKDGWWMGGPNGKVYVYGNQWNGNSWSYYTPPSANGYGIGGDTGVAAGSVAPGTGGYVGGVYYPDRSGTCG